MKSLMVMAAALGAALIAAAPAQASWWACSQVGEGPEFRRHLTLRLESDALWNYPGSIGPEWNFPQLPNNIDHQRYRVSSAQFRNNLVTWNVANGQQNPATFTFYLANAQLVYDIPAFGQRMSFNCSAIQDPLGN